MFTESVVHRTTQDIILSLDAHQALLNSWTESCIISLLVSKLQWQGYMKTSFIIILDSDSGYT